MPPRWACIVILAVWAAFTGLLVRAELLPLLRTGDPPPFAIDLVEEAQTRRSSIDWIVFLDGVKTFRARTAVSHPQRDVFEMTAEYRGMLKGDEVPYQKMVLLKKMSTTYRVTADGELLGVSMVFEGRKDPAFLANPFFDLRVADILKDPFVAELKGEYVGDEFRAVASLTLEDGTKVERPLPGREMKARASMLQPMHPVNRIAGLRPGQEWTTVMYNPLAETLYRLFNLPSDAPVVTARVLPETHVYEWNGRRTECHVIEYEGDNVRGRTMVEVRRGLVMFQELTLREGKVTMHRD